MVIIVAFVFCYQNTCRVTIKRNVDYICSKVVTSNNYAFVAKKSDHLHVGLTFFVYRNFVEIEKNQEIGSNVDVKI